MVDEAQTLTAYPSKTVALTQGLARNTFFNLIGWVWPIALAFVSVPYIVSQLGNDAYGIYAIVSIVAGYLGLLSMPVAMGNVRFMAGAYARQEWPELRQTAVTGVVIVGALSALGAVVMFLAADVLARSVFEIPAALVENAVIAFRLAATSFFLNGVAGALRGVPSAVRRYDILSLVSLSVGTLNTVGIVLAIWLGWGLLGAVVAQVLSSALAMMAFATVAWLLLRRFPGSDQKWIADRRFLRRFVSFSSLLFAGQVASTIGLQIDRTLIGVLLGTSAVTFYIVPTKITDKIPNMMFYFCTALYPLSSEAMATGKMGDLRRMYLEMVRILLWISAFMGTLVMVLSKDILMLWMGPEFMANSWLVLVLLAAGVIWRAPGSVAYQVCNGLGRADINLVASIGTTVLLTLPVAILAPRLGPPGAALGVFVGLALQNVAYDLFTQRKLLGCKNWMVSLTPYVRVALAVAATMVCVGLLHVDVTGWGGLVARACLVSFFYVGCSLVVGALQARDIRFGIAKFNHAFRKIQAWRTSL